MRLLAGYSARSLWARRVTTGATVLGLALVSFVLAAVLMLSRGIREALRAGGRADNLVVLRAGSTTEVVSLLERDAVNALAVLPEAAPSVERGRPLVAGEVVVIAALRRADGTFLNASVRGVQPESYALRPGVRIVEGRAPRPGHDELAIGSGLLGVTERARVGGVMEIAGVRFRIVGRLAARGAAFDSELWGDAERVARAFDRPAWSSALVRLRPGVDADEVARRIEADPRFTLKAEVEDRYWAGQGSDTAVFVRVLGVFVSVVFGAGAVLGATITMYGQVASRTRDLGTLRAIGFRARAVLTTVLAESALLGAAGGLLGSLSALVMRFVEIRSLNFQTFTTVRFGFAPSPGVLAASFAFGLGMGVLGGLLPAIRAYRLPVLTAMRRG